VSFRNRLALFFVLIVIVPMIAVAFLVFHLIDESAQGQAEAAIARQHVLASSIFDEEAARADVALKEIAADSVFTGALQSGDHERARRRAKQLLESRAIQRIVFVKDGKLVLRVGNKRATAPAVRDVLSSSEQPLGTLEVSVTDANAYVTRVLRLTGQDTPRQEATRLHAVVLNGDNVLATTLPVANAKNLLTTDGAKLTLGGTEYRVQNFTPPPRQRFEGQKIRVFTLGSIPALTPSKSDNRILAVIVLLGFLLLAIACAVLISRTLQQQIAAFLGAARRLAAGDFSAQVPTVGRDEFSALGEEFNKMSRELERRLAELTQERGRVQDSMRRLGEAVGANLDRDALLELVVRTAVDGVGADAGRASVRAYGGSTLQERSRVGNMNGLESAVASVEAEALSSGVAREATVGAANAIAHPLRGSDAHDEVVGVVSVGRHGRPFTPSDRELFTYLAGQAARSMENVDLHETAARESVTDDLTGLSNRRAFDAGLLGEVERAKRFGDDLGLLMIDLDNFGQFNKQYGLLDGDAVLREVGRVLRDGSREIDQPARYGGEELAVVLPGTDLDGAYNRAERIREQIELLRIPRVDGRGDLRVTASCGIASMRGAAADADALVDAASAALNNAKRSGKNTTRPAR